MGLVCNKGKLKAQPEMNNEKFCFFFVFFWGGVFLGGRPGKCHKPKIGNPPPPFLLSSAALEWWSMFISTGRTPIRYDMEYMLLTMKVEIVMIFVFFSILCNKQGPKPIHLFV